MWQAVVHELHNGSQAVYLQRDDDWESGRPFASFTELQQEEDPGGIERELELARHEAARLNAEELSAELARSLRHP